MRMNVTKKLLAAALTLGLSFGVYTNAMAQESVPTVSVQKVSVAEKLKMNPIIAKKAKFSWDVNGTQYKDFTDLGEQVILLGNYDKCDVKGVLAKIAEKRDIAMPQGCTATVKRNKAGDVLLAHNMDLDVTERPAAVFTTSFGKYKTFNVYYVGNDPQTYEQLKTDGKMDPELYEQLPFKCTDVFNEKGLYVSINMRFGRDKKLALTGTNPGKLRADSIAITHLTAMNCATVQEAVNYLKNELDIYPLNYPELKACGWNVAVMLGDAEGEYGIVEIAGNTVTYLPYCNGHANYFRSPEFEKLDSVGMGYGRFALAQKYLAEPQDIDGMMKMMSKIYYTKSISDVEYAHRDAKGKIVFCDENGNESLDWRSEYHSIALLDDNGNVIENPTEEDYAKCDITTMSDYLMSLYTGDKATAGKLSAKGEKLLAQFHRTGADWLLNDDNFEAVQKVAMKTNAAGNKVELVRKYRAGDEQPIRKDSSCWLSSIATGVNCKEKTFKVAFWEKLDKVCLTFKW